MDVKGLFAVDFGFFVSVTYGWYVFQSRVHPLVESQCARDNLTLQQLIGFDLWRVKEVDSALFQVSPYKEETNWKQIFILSFFLISHEMKKFLWRFTQSSIT